MQTLNTQVASIHAIITLKMWPFQNFTYINYGVFGKYYSFDVLKLAHSGEDLCHWLWQALFLHSTNANDDLNPWSFFFLIL